MIPLEPFEIPLRGARLIEANAGTGKTYTITTLYLRLLLESELLVDQILVVTYTNAATAELRRRVRDCIGDLLAELRDGAGSGDATIRALAERRRAAGSVARDCQRLAEALYGFDEAAIFTIHGFCQRILQEHAFESGVAFDTELIGDERLLIDEVVRDFWSRELYAAPLEELRYLRAEKVSPGSLSRLAQILAAHPGVCLVPEQPAALADALQQRRLQLAFDLVAYADRERRTRKLGNNTQSFDDLLQRLDTALQGSGADELADKIRQRFPAALIDEFQDTDPVQARIFARLYRDERAALFLIGDPKQAIYAFRGADVFSYVAAKNDVAQATYGLATNRRSSPGLVHAVNTLFDRTRAPFVLPGIPFFRSDAAPDAADALAGDAAGRAPLRFLFVARQDRPQTRGGRIKHGREVRGWFHSAIAGEITRLLNAATYIGAHRVVPGDIAVLCRSNVQSADVHAQLSNLGVPSVLYGDASVFETPEAAAVERVMRAMADPGDPAAVSAALLTPLLGLTGDDLVAARGDDRQWEEWVEAFQSWGDCWRSSGFTVAFRRLLDERDVAARVLARPGGERCITNVFHLGELLQGAAVEARRGPRALIEWLHRMRRDEGARAEEAQDAAQIRLESDTHALKLTTIHKSKGLQYPVVICPFLWDGMLLHPQDTSYLRFHDAGRLTLDLGSPDKVAHRLLAEREALAEQLRLLYVALTRAEQLCLVAWGQFATCHTSALGYLLHQVTTGREESWVESTADHIKGLSDAAMRADLERLATASDGAIEIVELCGEPPHPYVVVAEGASELRPRMMSRSVRQPWRLASFSALAATDQALPEPVEEGADRDELAETVLAAAADEVASVRGFPRGRRIGNLVHALFESIDFTAVDGAALRAEAERLLPLFGVEAAYGDALCAAVSDVLATPLHIGRAAMTLREIPPARRLNELEFVFPVALAAAETAPSAAAMASGQLALWPPTTRAARAAPFTAATLADVLTRHGAAWMADYAERVRRLPFAELSGYLKGFIDLVFAHGGQWFVVDYKTNDLGEQRADYRLPRLLAEMQRHHYVLQYHLYTVALHRYLQRRLPTYDYDRDFGGVLYLFVRGMAPHHEPGNGIFFDRPPRALVEGLSQALAGRAATPMERR